MEEKAEKSKLLYLPNKPFDVYRLASSVLDKYGSSISRREVSSG